MSKAPPGTARIVSWNVNGLRACAKKGFEAWLRKSKAEFVGLQEVRAQVEQLPETLQQPKGWHMAVSPAQRAGYSGVGFFSKREPTKVETSLGEERFDAEGRVQLVHFGRLVIANIYFPNGNGKERDNSRVPYKLDFYRALEEKLSRLRRGGRKVLVMGDFNTAHEAIDLARPKTNKDTSGFLQIERDEMTRWVDAGWVDTFRKQHPGEPDHYSWWTQRGGARERNVGWRIDYVMASKSASKLVKNAFILPDVLGSDHCPVGVDVDPAIFG